MHHVLHECVVGCPILTIKHVWACPDQSSRRGHRFLIVIMLFFVLRHPTCVSYIAWMCCRMSDSIKHVWASPNQSSRRGHRYLMQSCCSLCYVIQPVHHILHECVVGCPIISSMYDHVPIYLQLHVSSSTVHLHTFLHSLHSNFSPSRPLQRWFDLFVSSTVRSTVVGHYPLYLLYGT